MRLILPLSLAVAAAFCITSGDAAAESNAITAEIVKSRPLAEGRRTPAILRLDRQGGLPVLAEELEITHESPLHLLIVDPSLSDYHHEHPQPMNTPGEYIFTMTPRTACSYRVWADIDTKGGGQQFAVTDIPGAEDCKDRSIDRTESTVHESGNYRFLLEFDTDGLKVGQETTARLTVRDLKGRYITELEPVMGAFAHVVGIYDDYRTVAHIHPLDEAPTSLTDVAGPTLKFHITPAQEGFLKLFAQVKINGIVHHVPFGLTVKSNTVALDAWVPPEDEIPLPEDHVPVGEPSADDSASQDDAIERMMEEESRALAAEREKEKQEPAGLEDLYKGPGPASSNLYDEEEERLLQNTPEIQSVPQTSNQLPEDYSDEPLE